MHAKISAYSKHILFLSVFLASALPLIVFAENIQGVLSIILGIFDIVVAVLIGLALVLFIWGVVRYIGSQDNEAERTSARHQMIFGIVALFVIVSVWGLVSVLVNTFNLQETSAPQIPQIPG